MKKIFAMAAAAAVLVPGLALAQTQYYTSYPDLYQDRVRISSDQATLSRDQDILARDRSFGNWWAIGGDVQRVRLDQSQMSTDLTAYDADRGMLPRSYTYRYYR